MMKNINKYTDKQICNYWRSRTVKIACGNFWYYFVINSYSELHRAILGSWEKVESKETGEVRKYQQFAIITFQIEEDVFLLENTKNDKIRR